ncbi:MAG TPA: LON peptidase substrate-binding domain-containing protein [Tepidisphaeraceae bacterium]|nr:LON peptidase substrate-binding domain-containing protein [Tepidisphaeraceae bacterium]
MDDFTGQISGRLSVPLFPLPNVVLFPKVILPLHVFEDRYKRMTTDAIEGDGRIAMALLRPGWEKDYHCRPPIEPVVCVGQIVAKERLKGGEYNFLLRGEFRAQIVRESGGRPSDKTPYRVALLSPLDEIPALEIDLVRERQVMETIFSDGLLGGGSQAQELFSRPIGTADIADLVAFRYLEDVQLKQSLLAERDVRRRVEQVVRSLRGLAGAARPRRIDHSGLN